MTERDALIEHLIRLGYLTTPRVIAAFRAIDRADFVHAALRGEAYQNEPLPIGFGQTISQPLTVALMLEMLHAEPGETVLDVGSGSGWKAALLAHIVGEDGKVISIERIPELKEAAERNIEKYKFVSRGVVRVLLGDGSRGASAELVPERGFHRIIAGAAAEEKIPEAWRVELAVGGRIVAPVDTRITVIDRMSEKKFEERGYEGFRFVPLIANSH